MNVPSLPRFSMDHLSVSDFAVIVAARGKGKTTLIRHMIDSLNEPPCKKYISCADVETDQAKYQGIMGATYIDFQMRWYEELLHVQKSRPEEARQHVLWVWDNCLYEEAEWKKDILEDVAQSGKSSYKIGCIISGQYPFAMKPKTRANTDIVFLFPSHREQHKRMYELWCSPYCSYDVFEMYMNSLNQHECLVVMKKGSREHQGLFRYHV